jgi:hypothetical protein
MNVALTTHIEPQSALISPSQAGKPLSLAECVILGDSLKSPAGHLLEMEADGQFSACALGGALLAAGISPEEIQHDAQELHGELHNLNCVQRLWPFMKKRQVNTFCYLYHARVLQRYEHLRHVMTAGTIEDVAAYARAVDPQTANPELASQYEQQVTGYITSGCRDSAALEIVLRFFHEPHEYQTGSKRRWKIAKGPDGRTVSLWENEG